MACNCGGRGGGRATSTGSRSGSGVTWQHTDQYGGVVPYRDERTAFAALRRNKGRVDQLAWGTGAVLETTRYEDLDEQPTTSGRHAR